LGRDGRADEIGRSGRVEPIVRGALTDVRGLWTIPGGAAIVRGEPLLRSVLSVRIVNFLGLERPRELMAVTEAKYFLWESKEHLLLFQVMQSLNKLRKHSS